MNIKDYRGKELTAYIVANIAIMLLLSGALDINDASKNDTLPNYLVNAILRSAILATAIYCFVFIADSIIPSRLKEHMLYLKFGAMPGQVVFSKIAKGYSDKRFTTWQVLEKYKQIYEEMPDAKTERYAYENAKWYGIYNKYRDMTMIQVSNRDFLLCRDLYISSITMIVVYFFAVYSLSLIAFHCAFFIYLIIMSLLLNIAARIKACGFVFNVIAKDLHEAN